MHSKIATIISIVLTILILLALGVAVFFIDIVALNGFSEREGGTALIVAAVCGSISIILSAVLAGGVAKFLITKYDWHNVAVVFFATLAGTIVGSLFLGGAFALSLLVAEAMLYN